MLTEEGKHVLQEENFRSRDFWEGYKLYCFGHYSHCRRSKERFLASKMGRVVNLLQKKSRVPWGSDFDNRVREVWAIMEEYAENILGRDWKNLRALMERYDDVKELSGSENGCLLLQLIEDDDFATEHLLKKSLGVQVQETNVFQELQGRLKRVRSNLDSLKESSGASSKAYKNDKGSRCKKR